MFEHKRVKNLKYIISDFPPKPKREIKYALVRDRNELYFINQSNEVVNQVSTESFGYLTVDDTVYTPEDKPPYTYQDVLPGEGVLIENYDDSRVYDGYMLGMYIYINNEYRIRPRSHKGGIRGQIIIYGDGTTPRYVLIKDNINEQNK